MKKKILTKIAWIRISQNLLKQAINFEDQITYRLKQKQSKYLERRHILRKKDKEKSK